MFFIVGFVRFREANEALFPYFFSLKLLSISQIIRRLFVLFLQFQFPWFHLFYGVTLKQKWHWVEKQTITQRIKETSGINNFQKVMVLLAKVGGCCSFEVMGWSCAFTQHYVMQAPAGVNGRAKAALSFSCSINQCLS